MKEWYLMNNNTKPNSLGGFENQSFVNFKNDSFFEALDTEIACEVILYNFDLSVSQSIRCIIQNNTADTNLQSMERTILVPIGTLKTGNYIFYEDEYWIVDGRPDNNKIYEKATLKICQYLLKWQNSKGNIIERWCNITSASKYDVGETGSAVLFLSSNNYSIKIPNDIDSQSIEGKRVFIDISNENPTKVFKITRNDDVLYDFHSHGGILNLIADKTELNEETDCPALKICDYIPIITVEKEPLKKDNEIIYGNITYKGDLKITAGGNAKTFTAIFKDTDENVVDFDNYYWTCLYNDEFSDYISTNNIDGKLKIKVNYTPLIVGQDIILILYSDNKEIDREVLKIGGGL